MTARRISALAAGALLVACASPAIARRPKVYAQFNDSISEHCRYQPASCVGALGVEGGTAAAATTAPAAAVAPASADAIVAIGTGVLGASIVATAALSTDEQIGIEEILKQCASQAESEVLKERFGGKRPSAEQCNEHAGVNHLGEPLSLAMKLGDEMHRAAYRCLGEKLEKLIPSRFSVEQRYRFNPRNGRTSVITEEEAELLRRHGRGDELRDSIVPDLIIHKGDPRFVQAVYDFKFPCGDMRRPPQWRPYPNGHPATGGHATNQREVYRAILKKVARWVMPGKVNH